MTVTEMMIGIGKGGRTMCVKFCKDCKRYNERGEYGFVCDYDWGYFYAYGSCEKWEHR